MVAVLEVVAAMEPYLNYHLSLEHCWGQIQMTWNQFGGLLILVAVQGAVEVEEVQL